MYNVQAEMSNDTIPTVAGGFMSTRARVSSAVRSKHLLELTSNEIVSDSSLSVAKN